MDKVIEYIGEVLPDGRVSIPEEIRQTLAASPHAQIQVTIKLLQSDEERQQEAWEVFRRMGQDAKPGSLKTPPFTTIAIYTVKKAKPYGCGVCGH